MLQLKKSSICPVNVLANKNLQKMYSKCICSELKIANLTKTLNLNPMEYNVFNVWMVLIPQLNDVIKNA